MNVSIGGIAKTVEITSFDKLGDVKVCMLTTTADGSVGFEQLNDEVRDTIYASFPVDNAKGSIASFEDGADNVPVRELKLNLEPYQNLNGYDNPWVGGAGKNLYNSKGLLTYSSQGVTVTESNGTLTFNGTATGTGYFTINNLNLPVGDYRFAIHNSATSSLRVSFQDLDDNYFLDTTIDAVGKILAITNRSIKQLLFYTASGQSYSNYSVKPQLEKGTVATSWTPYENICPIYPANGKNLYDSVTREDGYISATGTVTVDGSSVHSALIPVTPNQPIVFSGLTVGSGGGSTKRLHGYNSSGTWVQQLGYASNVQDGTRYTISATVPSGITGVKISFRGTDEQVQVEHGTSPSVYVPYNAIGITRTGKNLYIGSPSFDGFNNISTYTKAGETYNGHEVIYKASAWAGACKPIHVKRGYTYTFSAMVKVSVANKPVFLYGSSGLVASKTIATANTWTRVSGTYSATKDSIEEFRIESESNSYTVYLSEFQLEVGSTATEYEPYTADRYYIDSSTPIYGGTLEVETGLLTVTHIMVGAEAFTGWGGSGTSAGGLHWFNLPTSYPAAKGGMNDRCSFAPYIANVGEAWASTQICLSTNTGGFPARVYDSSTSIQDFAAKYAGQTVVYEVATPQTYQLTPVQVKTLLGYNNIWTDSGTVEVQYLANIGLYIQKIIGATEDDMVANQNISANKYFFVGEELYYSTSAISAGQTIVVGTNCIKTNLADALNALNS